MAELRGKVALVTGASGFVGSFVARRLLREGVEVRALVRRPESAEEVRQLGAEPVLGDLGDGESLRKAVEGAQLVVHCALALLMEDMEGSRRLNVGGTVALMEAARAEGCERIVHTSSIAVYDLVGRSLVDEETPLIGSGDPYSVSKAEGDRALLAAMAQGLPATILRPPFVLGAHPRSSWGNLMPRLIAAGQLGVVGDGGCSFPYVHVESLAEAMVLALRQEAAVGQVFNLVDGHSTWREYTGRFNPAPPQVPEEQAPHLLRMRGRYSGARAERVLGYAPRYTFEQALQDTQRLLAGG